MQRTLLIVITALAAIFILLLLLYPSLFLREEMDEVQDQTENGGETLPAGWERYQHDEHDFSVAHPKEVVVTAEGESHVRFSFAGPEDEEGTEITDGFTFTVGVHNAQADATLFSFARAQLDERLEVAEEVRPLATTTFEGEVAYTFTAKGLGEVTTYVFLHTGNRFLTASYNIADPNDAGYQEVVNEMLRSLERLPADVSKG